MLAVERLASKDIVLVGHGTKGRLLARVAAITDFPNLVLAEHSGWVGNQFVLPDGQVFSPSGVDPAEVVFAVDPMKCHRAGTVVGWRRHVAEPLSTFDLPSFLLMMPFAAPLLALTDRADNIGFELVGVRGRGKSTLQELMASAVGAPSRPAQYWISLDTTLAGLECQMPIHNDLPLIMDEANLYLANTTDGGEARHMRRLAFKLANGHTTARHGDKLRSTGSRYVTLISANDSFQAVTATARGKGFLAAADRLITLTMPDRPGGAINGIPDGYTSTGEFMDAVKAAARTDHGVAMPRFIQRLVDRRHRDEAGLRQVIASGLADFRRAAGTDESDGSARRVADAFGLIAVAGQAAVEYQVLPRSFRCTEVALACYNANRLEAA
jgi:hypothetical protein